MSKDYYHILGVPRDSSKEDIKRAYFILANQYHPDKPNGSEKRFKEINEAYRILSYDNSRAQHDEELKSSETRNSHDFKEASKSEEQTKNTIRGSDPLSFVIVAVVGITSFILAFVVMKYITQEGISAVRDGVSKNQATQKVTNYFTDNSTWKDFNSTLGNFRASFPVYPAHETEPLNLAGLSQPVNMEIYSAEESNGVFYLITFINYPSQVDTSVQENNLEGSVNGAVQSMDGTLISSNFTYFGTYRAIEFLIYKKDGSSYIKGKNILVGQNLYSIMVGYEPSNSSNVQFDRFANSFQLQ